MGLPLAVVVLLCCLLLANVAEAVTSPMPYRPGYGLGSWIPPQVITGMKKEAYARSAILLSEQMDSAAESLARELKMAMNPVSNPNSDRQEIPPPLDAATARAFADRVTATRARAWGAKVRAYEQLFDQIDVQLDELETAAKGDGSGSVQAFTTFASAVSSPVIWSSSHIASMDRAFDSFTTGSTFMRVDVTKQSKSDTTSSSTDQDVRNNRGWFGWTSRHSRAVATEAASRLTEARSSKSIEQTLVLTSFATHRKVRQFKTLNLDADRLRDGWNFFHGGGGEDIPNPSIQPDRFIAALMEEMMSANASAAPEKISLVTEMFLGSTMVGFVHFIKVESTSNIESASAYQTAEARSRFALFLSSRAGSTSFSRDSAAKMAQLASDAMLQIEFDLVCLGYIPTIKSQKVKLTVSEFKTMDVNAQGSSEAGAKGQTAKQDNAKSVIEGTLGAVNKIESENPVLGIETFMDAFDDFAQAAHSRPDEVGAPIGLNVREFSRAEIMMLLAQENFGSSDAGTSSDDNQEENEGTPASPPPPPPPDAGTPTAS